MKIETDPEQQDYSASSRARDAAAEGPACEPSPVPRRSLARRASLALALLLSVSALALAPWFGVHGLRLDAGFSCLGGDLSRAVVLGLAGLMVVGPLIFMGMVWLAISRERRQAEALSLLRDNREALRMSRDQLRRVFGSLPLPYVLIRQDGCIVQANPQAIALFGIDPEDA